jgi:hypothetical protein
MVNVQVSIFIIIVYYYADAEMFRCSMLIFSCVLGSLLAFKHIIHCHEIDLVWLGACSDPIQGCILPLSIYQRCGLITPELESYTAFRSSYLSNIISNITLTNVSYKITPGNSYSSHRNLR